MNPSIEYFRETIGLAEEALNSLRETVMELEDSVLEMEDLHVEVSAAEDTIRVMLDDIAEFYEIADNYENSF